MSAEHLSTLERIHAAARDEFLEKGFQEASLRNIGKTAGVTTGAFYGYYGSKAELFRAGVALLPQDPLNLMVKKTVRGDLEEMLDGRGLTAEQRVAAVGEVATLTDIAPLLDAHPFDLSGGEVQRAVLAKVLLCEPRLLLLDEPTKGLDAFFKDKLARLLRSLTARGTTVLMVSHDVEFCASYADWCALFFDGNVVTTNPPRQFFASNSFYTTAANRISRGFFENVVTVEEVVELCRS